jgi:hypothetical protein
VVTGFPKRSCSNRKIERDDDRRKVIARTGARLAVNGKPWVRAGLFCRRAG